MDSSQRIAWESDLALSSTCRYHRLINPSLKWWDKGKGSVDTATLHLALLFTSKTALSWGSGGNHAQCFRCQILFKLSHLFKVWLKWRGKEGGTQCPWQRQSCFHLVVFRLFCRWSFRQYWPNLALAPDYWILFFGLVQSFLSLASPVSLFQISQWHKSNGDSCPEERSSFPHSPT